MFVMMRRFLLIVFCVCPLFVKAQSLSYTRVFIENRCYYTVESHVMKAHETINLPSVAPRDQQLVIFTTNHQITPNESIYFSRQYAQSTSMLLVDLLNQSRHETWSLGAASIDSFFITLCGKEKPLEDQNAKTVMKATGGETVTEYELLFTKVAGSRHPEDVLSHYPVRLLLNGVPASVLKTDGDGILRFLLQPNTGGTITMQALPSITRELVIGENLNPVRNRAAQKGEQILVQQVPVSQAQDW